MFGWNRIRHSGRERQLAPRPAAFLLIAALASITPAPAHALRVVSWNLFAYPDYNLAGRQPQFRKVMANIDADVLVVQELLSQAGRDSFLTNVLDVVEPGEWTGTAFFNLQASPSPEGGAIFWKPAKVSVGFVGTFATSGPRDILLGRVTPVGYTNISATFRVYSMHFKAGGPATVDSTTRRLEATDARGTLNLAPANTNILFGGDSNIYGAYEGAFIRLTESQIDNDGRLKDLLNLPGVWHVNATYGPYFTQCPCATGCGSFSGGGLDDRFDLWLSSYSMQDGEGVDFTALDAYGNDGNHYNTDLDAGGFNAAVPLDVATALRFASDHLPVIATVQLAAKVQAASAVSFGPVLVGATATQDLAVSNPAPVPADELNYSFAAPSGFTAPAGGFVANAGAAANLHTLTMASATTGVKSGTLTMTTDDRDSLSKPVQLSGTVLAHATPSLDSLAAVLSDSVRFGAHAPGEFIDQTVRVHNRGWNALTARLSVANAVITGGDGRFSIAGGFTPDLVSGTARTWNVHFDDTGASTDTAYTATLTFTTADEPLPGAAAQSPLTLEIAAYVQHVNNAVEPGLPARLAFAPPRPNPARGTATFRFDVPEDSDVALEVYDLSGRRVATVWNGHADAGHRELSWSARRDDGAALEAGLYFARFAARGVSFTRRLVLLP